jgi:hypothetical protein
MVVRSATNLNGAHLPNFLDPGALSTLQNCMEHLALATMGRALCWVSEGCKEESDIIVALEVTTVQERGKGKNDYSNGTETNSRDQHEIECL